MKTPDSNVLIDVVSEKQAVLDFVYETWYQHTSHVIKDEIALWTNRFFDIGYNLAGGWINRDVTNFSYEIMQNAQTDDISLYWSQVGSLFHKNDYRAKDGVRYETELKKGMNGCYYQWPWRLSPKGWYELIDEYEEYDHITSWNYRADDFHGHFFKSAVTRPFHERIALPYVMRNELWQASSRKEELLGAVMVHGMSCREHNNSVKIIKDMTTVYEATGDSKEVVKGGEVEAVVNKEIFAAVDTWMGRILEKTNNGE